MTAPRWWKAEVTPGNVVSWLISAGTVVAMIVWLQADVKALQKMDEQVERRLGKVEDRAEQDRAAIHDMRGDIRVIRQILEAQRK